MTKLHLDLLLSYSSLPCLTNPKALPNFILAVFLLHFPTLVFEQCLTLVLNYPSLFPECLPSLVAYNRYYLCLSLICAPTVHCGHFKTLVLFCPVNMNMFNLLICIINCLKAVFTSSSLASKVFNFQIQNISFEDSIVHCELERQSLFHIGGQSLNLGRREFTKRLFMTEVCKIEDNHRVKICVEGRVGSTSK